MEKYFLPYAESLELKELGFDEPCLAYWKLSTKFYNLSKGKSLYGLKFRNTTDLKHKDAAPLIQQAKKFLRDKYKLHIHICYFEDTKVWHSDIYSIESGNLKNSPMQLSGYKTYKGAELEAIRECIKIIKNEQEKTKEKTL